MLGTGQRHHFFLLFGLCLAIELSGGPGIPLSFNATCPAEAARIDWFLQPVWEQASRFSEGRAAVRSGGLWGFINPVGQWLVTPRYADASPFHDGLAAVAVGEAPSRWGFVDGQGQFVIPPQFDYASRFSEGLAAVLSGDRWGYVDKQGKLVIGADYGVAGDFYEGRAVVALGGVSSFIDKTGRRVFDIFFDQASPLIEDRAAVTVAGKMGFIDGEGRMVISPDFQPIPGGRVFNEGLAGVALRGLWGFIKLDGTWFFEPACEAVKDFSEGLGAVRRGGLWGFISLTGELVIPCVFEDVMPFSEGTACAKSGGRWGYIDRQGAWMSDPSLLEAWPFHEGLAPARSASGQWGYMGRNIAPLFEGRAFDHAGSFSDGFALVKAGGREFYINASGQEDEKGARVRRGEPPVSTSSAPVVPFQAASGLWGYKRQSDDVILIPPFLEHAEAFHEGRAAVSLAGKWWYIPLIN